MKQNRLSVTSIGREYWEMWWDFLPLRKVSRKFLSINQSEGSDKKDEIYRITGKTFRFHININKTRICCKLTSHIWSLISCRVVTTKHTQPTQSSSRAARYYTRALPSGGMFLFVKCISSTTKRCPKAWEMSRGQRKCMVISCHHSCPWTRDVAGYTIYVIYTYHTYKHPCWGNSIRINLSLEMVWERWTKSLSRRRALLSQLDIQFLNEEN